MLVQDYRHSIMVQSVLRYGVRIISVGGWMILLNRSFDKRNTISKIELVKHADNERFSSEVQLSRQDGYKWKVPIKSIKHIGNNHV